MGLGARTVAVMLLALPLRIAAQPPLPDGIITGVVRDTGSRPVPGADIIVRPGDRRTRTDSAGRFTVGGLAADDYAVRARRLGYAPTAREVSLRRGGRADITLVFERAMPMLDTIVVTGTGTCSEHSLDGFVCRRRTARGVFLDYTEIDDRNARYTADLFRDMKGFREVVRPSRFGPVRAIQAHPPWGCITTLVDGRPMTGATPIPELPRDLVALEVYAAADSVPAEFQRHTWPGDGATRSGRGRCSLIVYWTFRARQKPD